ncbi:Helicase with zinc finger domain 2 [Holothuria leucospilota]|uniref:Helicase with zinc finger domain 2 n=1 Tax=Holothuria leucospilota TaxID=206669 RepID=A0A9Q1C7J9_HOLLE|nr:Helicase with zinc finger domain 2 [Holothuria leucospilota]
MLQKPPRQWKTLATRNLNSIDLNVFGHDIVQKLSSTDFDNDNLDECVGKYNRSLKELLNKHALLRTRRIVIRPNTSWYNEEIRTAKSKRKELERKWHILKLEVDRQVYCKQRQIVNWLIEAAKSSFYSNAVADCHGNQKHLFGIVSNLLHKPNDSILPSCHSEQALANQFSDYFVEKIDRIRRSFRKDCAGSVSLEGDGCCPRILNFEPTTNEEVERVFMKAPTKSCDQFHHYKSTMDDLRMERVVTIQENWIRLWNLNEFFMPPKDALRQFIDELLKDMVAEAIDLRKEKNFSEAAIYLHRCLLVYVQYIYPLRLEIQEDELRVLEIRIFKATMSVFAFYPCSITFAMEASDKHEAKKREAQQILAIAKAGEELVKYRSGKVSKIMLQRHQKNLHHLNGTGQEIMLNTMMKELDKELGPYEEAAEAEVNQSINPEWIPDHVKNHKKQTEASKSKKPEKKKKSRSRPTRPRTDSSVSAASGSFSNHVDQKAGGDQKGNGQLKHNDKDTDSEDSSSASKDSSDNMIQNDKLNHVSGSGDHSTIQGVKPKVPQSRTGNHGYGLDGISEFEHHPHYGQKLQPRSTSPYQGRPASPAPQPSQYLQNASRGQRPPTPPPQRLLQPPHLGKQPIQSAPRGQRSSTPPPQRVPQPPHVEKQPHISVPLPSPTTQQWLRNFDFKLACVQCFTKHPQQEGIFAFNYNHQLNHVCNGDILICLLKSLENLGKIWGRIRQRPSVEFLGTFRLCNFFFRGLNCQVKSNLCHFAHSQEELIIWDADRARRFNGKELVSYLRNKKIQQAALRQQAISKVAQASGTSQSNLRASAVQSSHGVVQPPARQPSPGPSSPTSGKAPVKRTSEEVKSPPHQPSPRPPSPAPGKPSKPLPQKSQDKNKNQAKKAVPEKVIEFTTYKSQKVVELVRQLQGYFIFCCGPCFHGAPPRVSVQNQKKLSWCTNDEMRHEWNVNSRVLVFFNYAEGFWKVRPRPPNRPPRVALCWHKLRHYGCSLGDRCGFAHNSIEVEVWEFEVNYGISREEIVEVSEAVHKPPEEPKKEPKKKAPAPPKAAPSKPVTHKGIPPFEYTMRILCGICYPNAICEQSKVNPRKCSSSNQHPWGTNSVYQLLSASKSWVRVFPRHPKLRRGLYPMMCKRGRRCSFREERNLQCMFAHYQEEIYLWHYQDVHNLLTIEKVLEANEKGGKVDNGSQAQLTSSQVTVPTGSKGAGSRLFCMYCKVPFYEKWQLEDHLKSQEHISRVNSDKEKTWEHRDPPTRVTNGEYQKCLYEATGMCRYSGKPDNENLCEWAHSDEELQEWKERHKYRMMKMEKVREQKLFSFLDGLIQEYNFTKKKETVMIKLLPGVQVTCTQPYEIFLPLEKRTEEGSFLSSWEFKVILSEQKELKRVGLLYDEFRQHFYLSKPSGENQPQVCPGNMIAEDTTRRKYSFKVFFSSNVLGTFHQRVIFDFKSKPVLYVPLQVNIGSENFQPEFSSETVNFKEPWNVHNSVIIKYPSRFPEDPLYQDLKKKYPPPKTEEIQLEEGHRLNRNNFREHFHTMLALEELACNERLKRFSGRTKLDLFDAITDGMYERAPDGELFAKISLSDSLLDDSEASQIVVSDVRYVLLKFEESANVVYQAEICMDRHLDLRRDDSLYVRLGQQCVQERQLGPNKTVKVLFQFQLERLKFCEMHFGVDEISEEFLMFPPANCVPRFPGVRKEECGEMNPRQADASKYILGAGKSLPFVPGPTLIIGPFGTGKTQTMAKTIIKLLDQTPDNKILVCTHSNSAADWLVTSYLHPFLETKKKEQHWYNRKILRVYATMKSPSSVSQEIRENYVICEEGTQNFRKPTHKDIMDCNIVVTTLSTSIHLVTLNEAGKSVKGYFEYIFIDEAGQALETEAMIPLGLAIRNTVVVLAGDHIQMRPKVYSEVARAHEFQFSMLERLFHWDKRWRCKNVCFLTYNYRMRREILDFIARYHYQNKLVAQIDHYRHPNYYPMSFLTVKGVDQLIGTSYVNMAEVTAIVEKINELIRQWPHQWRDIDIAVLTPYRLQVDQIRRALRSQGLGMINVESVQNVQGKQFRAVFISTVRTRNTLNKAQITAIPQSGQAGHNQKYYYGFLSDEGELVTAFTRCQSFLYVVGDPVSLCSVGDCHTNWKKYIETCERNNSLYPEGSSMALIKQEIEAAKQTLNPLASTFKPKSNPIAGAFKDSRIPTPLSSSTFPKAQVPPSAWSKGPPNVFTRSTTWQQKTIPSTTHTTFERLSSHEYPPLPAPQEEAVEDEFGDYEGELDIDDEILKELKRQVKMDEKIIKEDNFWDILEDSEEKSEDDDSFVLALSDSETEEEATTVEASKVDVSGVAETKDLIQPSQNHQVEKRKKAKFRMVERDEGIFLVRDNRDRSTLQGADDFETYDSDGEEVHETALEADKTDEWLRLTLEQPDDYKVCVVRFEPSGRVYAVPGDGSSTEEITISSKRRRERALDGDKVVMHILKEKEGGYEPVPNVDDVRKVKKVYGEVKHILERASNPKFKKVVCTVDPVNHDLMCPVDRSSPKMFSMGRKDRRRGRGSEIKLHIYTISRHGDNQFHENRTVVVKAKDIPERLFVVQYFEWFAGNPYPMGIITEELPKCDSPANGMRILKLMYNIKDNWPPSFAKEIEDSFPSTWEIPKEELIARQDGDFRSKDIFTIDPPDSLDLDDALHVERLEDNMLRVGVHIADVSYFVRKGSNLDKEAEKRATTFYPAFYARPSHMLPSVFSTTLCSLLPSKDRLSITVMFTFDTNANVIGSPQILRSVVCPVQRLTYEQVEKFLINPDGKTEILGVVRQQLLNLHNLTSFLRTKRLGDGRFSHDPDVGEKEVQFTMAHTVVEEMMLLANEAVATYLIETYGMNVPVRHQLPPDAEKAKEWLETFENDAKIGLKLNSLLPAIKDVIDESELSSKMKDAERSKEDDSETSSIPESDITDFSEENDQEEEVNIPLLQTTWSKINYILSNSNNKLLDLQNIIGDENANPKQAVALAQLFRILGKAFYINASDQPDHCQHFSLQKEFYTHFTSPIRRYLDLVIHRMVKAAVDGERNPYSAQELANICHHCNNQSFKAKKFEMMTHCLLTALKLKMAAEPKLGIIEMASDNGLQVLYPHERFLQTTRSVTSLPLRYMKPAAKPEDGVDKNSIVLHFKNSIYDQRTSIKEVPELGAPLMTNRFVRSVPKSTWETILSCMKGEDASVLEECLFDATRRIQESRYDIVDQSNRIEEVTCEVEVRNEPEGEEREPKKYVKFHRDFHPSQVVQVQLTSGIQRGLLVPKVQLMHMTPKFSFCFEHRENAVTCFAKIAERPPERSATIKKYVEAWLPVVEMMVAYNTVSGDETKFIRDVEVQWYRKSVDDRVVICGCFSLNREWCSDRHIGFFTPQMKGNKGKHGKEDDDIEEYQEDLILRDYVCVRVDGFNLNPSVQYKMKQLELKPGCGASDLTNPHGGKFSLVVHGTTSSAILEKRNMNERYTVEFEVNQMSGDIPMELFDQGKKTLCTVELIPKSKPDKRMEEALVNVGKTEKKECGDLIRKICLQKSGLPLESFIIDLRKCTGKTRTGAYLAFYFHTINQGLDGLPRGAPQILYCGPSNKSVDVISSYLKEFMKDDFSVIRVYSESIEQQEFPIPGMASAERKWGSGQEAHMDPTLASISLHHRIRSEFAPYAHEIRAMERRFNDPRRRRKVKRKEITQYKKLLQLAEVAELKRHQVILCTCNASGRVNLKRALNIIQCIVDEAGMCSEPETLIPLVTHNPYQVVLIGDHMQLRPIILEPNARDLGAEKSLMEKYKERAHTLTIQYRMHEEICRIPSNAFYEGQLETADAVKRRSLDVNTQRIWPNGPGYPRVFCHVVGAEETLTVRSEEGNEMSRSNPQEARHVIRIVGTLVKNFKVDQRKVVVLSQYRLQCAQIEEKLKHEGLDKVLVSTVIKSQGSEWDYVVLSTVRSMPKIEVEDHPGKGWKMRHLGFTMDENQMNVALTRARRGLIIVGNKYLLGTMEKWKALLKSYNETNSLIQAKDFLNLPSSGRR